VSASAPARSSKSALARRLASVRLVAFDFDGVFTDNRVWVSEDGTEAVCCTRADGLGLRKLEAHGIATVIISTETNPVVSLRARKLGTPCMQGCDDKVAALNDACAAMGITPADAAFIGNDINDAACLAAAGVPIVVADAHPDVRGLAAYRTQAPGGRGAVREVCDLIDDARTRAAVRRQRPRTRR